MHFLKNIWAVLPFISLVSGAALSPLVDETNTVLADLSQVGGNTTALNKTINSVPDNGKYNFFQLVTLNGQTNNATAALNATLAATDKSSTFTVADSKRINAAINSLTPIVYSTLNNLVAHKQAVNNSGVTSQVHSSLETQRGIVAQLGAAFQKKAPNAQYKKIAAQDTKQQLAHFDAAAAAFA